MSIPQDDRPTETIGAVIKAIRRLPPVAGDYDRDQQAIPRCLRSYGPLARPAVRSLIEHFGKQPSSSFFNTLTAIGGEEAMAFMIGALPQVRNAAGENLSPDSGRHSDLPAWRRALAYHACRWGIERGAGRLFQSDEDIVFWWETAAGKTQEDWLKTNLEQTLSAADAGNAKAQAILRAIVPQLPYPQADLPFDPPGVWRTTVPYLEDVPDHFRANWWRENRSRLRYDATTLTFRMN